jgi:Na+-translocating ferredoxin:NAD+ oxidoreductase RnfD subunit
MGLLLAMMLPVHASPLAAGIGACTAMLIARALRDRWKSHIWHPAALAWLLTSLVTAYLPSGAALKPATDTPRPIDLLAQAYEHSAGTAYLRELALYHLPRWEATLFGRVPGGIGETCTLAILAIGLWLIYLRKMRWQTPACALLAAAVVAAVWPLRDPSGELHWLPVVFRESEFPVGTTLVLYHLTGGGLLLAAVLHSADKLSTPRRGRGHAIFGAGLGAATVALRASGLPYGACWYALLLMNTLAPLINHLTRRHLPPSLPGSGQSEGIRHGATE